MKEIKEAIAQFIPILLIFLYFSNKNHFILFSHTVPGKLISLIVILFYSYIDPLIGMLSCTIIIIFYQMDHVENMLNMYVWNNEEPPSYYGFSPIIPPSLKQFRDNNCKNKVLQYKNMKVSNEMAPHIFSQLSYNDRVCNPCDNSCDVTIGS